MMYRHDSHEKGNRVLSRSYTETKTCLHETYYNFKTYPEKILQVLTDYTPWLPYSAIRLFYQMVRWLNGPDSSLESNECTFDGVIKNRTLTFSTNLMTQGTLKIFYRTPKLNTKIDCCQKLSDALLYDLSRFEQKFTREIVYTTIVPAPFLKFQHAEEIGRQVDPPRFRVHETGKITPREVERSRVVFRKD